MPTRHKTLPLYPKELSWLSFNARVLQEAEDPEVPLIERVRFMGIFSNNLDEFYRVRYAEVRRLAAFAKGREKARWEKLLDDIRDAVGDLQMRFDRVYRTCLAQLRENNIYLVDERQLDAQQREFARQYFFARVMPGVTTEYLISLLLALLKIFRNILPVERLSPCSDCFSSFILEFCRI